MHKYSRPAVIVAAVVLWMLTEACSGLIYDDTGRCNASVTLRFQYEYNGRNLLKEKIKTVHLILFDANGLFFGTREITAAEYAANSVPLALPKGKYTIVAAGNLTSRASIYPSEMKKGVTRFSDVYFAHPNVRAGKPVQGNAPVYLSTFDADIPAYPQKETYTATFRKKHMSFNIYVKGNSQISGNDVRIEMKNLYPHITLGGELTGSRATYYPIGTKEGENNVVFRLNTLGKETPGSMTVILRDAQGNLLKEIKIADYIKENNLKWDVSTEEAIDLVLMWYKNAWIGITIERWKEIQITPEY